MVNEWSPVVSRSPNDCAAVSIANVFDYAYDDVFAFIAVRQPGYPVDGAMPRVTTEAIDHYHLARYGAPYTSPGPHRPGPRSTGLMCVQRRGNRFRHLVAVFTGMVQETDGRVIPLRMYLELKRFQVAWFVEAETRRKITADWTDGRFTALHTIG